MYFCNFFTFHTFWKKNFQKKWNKIILNFSFSSLLHLKYVYPLFFTWFDPWIKSCPSCWTLFPVGFTQQKKDVKWFLCRALGAPKAVSAEDTGNYKFSKSEKETSWTLVLFLLQQEGKQMVLFLVHDLWPTVINIFSLVFVYIQKCLNSQLWVERLSATEPLHEACMKNREIKHIFMNEMCFWCRAALNPPSSSLLLFHRRDF